MKSYKILCLAIASVLIYSLSACNDSESKVSVNTDTSAPVSTSNPFDSDANSTDDFGEELIIDEDGYDQYGIFGGDLPGYSIHYLDFQDKTTYEYNGEELSLELEICNGDAPLSYTLGLICNDRLIPFSLNGGEYAYSFNSYDNTGDTKFTFTFHPYGKKGESVKVFPMLIIDTESPSYFKDFDVPNHFRALPTSHDIFYAPVNMNSDGPEENTPITVNDNIIPVEDNILEAYKEPERTRDEYGNEIEINRLEEYCHICIIQNDGSAGPTNRIVANDGERIKFDYVFCGRPRQEYIMYCWSNEGFLPIFDGEYQTKVCLDDFNQEIKMTFDVSLEDYPDLNNIRFIAYEPGNYIYSSVFSVFDEKTMQELNDWLETIDID